MKTELRTTHFSLTAPCTVYGVLDTLVEAGIASGQLEQLGFSWPQLLSGKDGLRELARTSATTARCVVWPGCSKG